MCLLKNVVIEMCLIRHDFLCMRVMSYWEIITNHYLWKSNNYVSFIPSSNIMQKF